MTMKDAFKAELEMRNDEYLHAMARGIDLLQGAFNRPPSTHVGHNLANIATDLSVIAGKIEAAKSALMFIEEQEKAAQ